MEHSSHALQSAKRYFLVTTLGFALSAAAFSVQAFTGEQYAKEAKVSLPEARATALKAFHGKVVDEELEREKGGSGLRYSFDIRHGQVTQEVGVDANTGRVLENGPEGPNAD
jgi:uncharacterized membrane protein YkoI